MWCLGGLSFMRFHDLDVNQICHSCCTLMTYSAEIQLKDLMIKNHPRNGLCLKVLYCQYNRYNKYPILFYILYLIYLYFLFVCMLFIISNNRVDGRMDQLLYKYMTTSCMRPMNRQMFNVSSKLQSHYTLTNQILTSICSKRDQANRCKDKMKCHIHTGMLVIISH